MSATFYVQMQKSRFAYFWSLKPGKYLKFFPFLMYNQLTNFLSFLGLSIFQSLHQTKFNLNLFFHFPEAFEIAIVQFLNLSTFLFDFGHSNRFPFLLQIAIAINLFSQACILFSYKDLDKLGCRFTCNVNAVTYVWTKSKFKSHCIDAVYHIVLHYAHCNLD